MALSARGAAILQHRVRHPVQQFGQADDVYTANGATGCTHTGLQEIDHIWTGRWLSHDAISRLVGYPNQSPITASKRRGLRPTEVSTFLGKRGLPYQVRSGISADTLLQLVARGPVGFGMAYSWVPEWMGRVYNGIKADGKPNGWAHPLSHAGKTQLSGFTGAHFGLLLAYDPGSQIGTQVTYWEPNHNSPSRTEKPPYDQCSVAQWRKLYGSYQAVLGRSLYSVIPTKTIGTVR